MIDFILFFFLWCCCFNTMVMCASPQPPFSPRSCAVGTVKLTDLSMVSISGVGADDSGGADVNAKPQNIADNKQCPLNGCYGVFCKQSSQYCNLTITINFGEAVRIEELHVLFATDTLLGAPLYFPFASVGVEWSRNTLPPTFEKQYDFQYATSQWFDVLQSANIVCDTLKLSFSTNPTASPDDCIENFVYKKRCGFLEELLVCGQPLVTTTRPTTTTRSPTPSPTPRPSPQPTSRPSNAPSPVATLRPTPVLDSTSTDNNKVTTTEMIIVSGAPTQSKTTSSSSSSSSTPMIGANPTTPPPESTTNAGSTTTTIATAAEKSSNVILLVAVIVPVAMLCIIIILVVVICCIIRNRERDDEKSVQNVELTTRQSATTVNSAPFEYGVAFASAHSDGSSVGHGDYVQMPSIKPTLTANYDQVPTIHR